MRALVNFERSPYKVELREKPVPEIGDDEVLLAVRGVGVRWKNHHRSPYDGGSRASHTRFP